MRIMRLQQTKPDVAVATRVAEITFTKDGLKYQGISAGLAGLIAISPNDTNGIVYRITADA